MRERKLSRRAFSLLLVLMLVVMLLPTQGFAATKYTQLTSSTISEVADMINGTEVDVYYYNGSTYTKCTTATSGTWTYIGPEGSVGTSGSSYYYAGKGNQYYYVMNNSKAGVSYNAKNLYSAPAGSSLKESTLAVGKDKVSLNEKASTVVSVTATGCTVSVASDKESVATASVEGDEITITAVKEGTAVITVSGKAEDGYETPDDQTITVTVTAPEYPDHVKSISVENDEYTLSLNVTARDKAGSSGSSEPGTEGQSKADVLVIIDGSYSMNDKDSSSTDSYGNARTKSESVNRALITKSLWSVDGGILYTLSRNVDSWRISTVGFSNTADQVLNWSEDIDSVYSAVWAINGQYGNETNIYAGLTKGTELLGSARSDARKIVVFISDGDPNVRADGTVSVSNYDEQAAADALEAAEQMKGLYDDFYVIGYAYKDSGNEFLAELCDAVGADLTNANGISEIEKKLAEIEEKAEEPLPPSEPEAMSNVVIADTLSEYVELSNTEETENYGITVTPVDTDFTVAVNGKKVSVALDGELEDGETYTVNIPVKPSKEAQDAANQGEKTTTSVPTNAGATLTYQYGDDDAVTVDYEEEPEITLEKEFYLHHMSDDSVETIKWSELQDGKIDVTQRVKDSNFYGGLFLDEDYTEASTVPGTELVPEGGKTYYMREVSETYLRIRMEHIYPKDKTIKDSTSTYAMTVVDSDQYYQKVGLDYSSSEKNNFVTDTVYENLRVITSQNTFENSVKEIFGMDGYMAIDTYNLRRNKISGTVSSYWITLDGVKVPSYVRTLEEGLKSDTVDDARSTDSVTVYNPSETPLAVEEWCIIREDDDDPAQEDPDARLKGYTLSLEGDISLNFYIQLGEDEIQDPNARVVFTCTGGNHTDLEVPMSKARAVPSYGENVYAFPIGVAAKDMTGEITATFITGDGAKSDAFPGTVQYYCDYVINNPTKYDESTVVLAKAILNYGAYSQLDFNYNTVKLAYDIEEGMSEEDKQLAEVDVSSISDPVKSGSCTGAEYSATSAMLTTVTGLRHYFKLDGDASDYTFTARGETLEVETSSLGTYVLIDDIWANQLGDPVELTVTNKEDGSTFTISYSVHNYIKKVLKSTKTSEADKNMAKALYAYYQAAVTFFETHPSN